MHVVHVVAKGVWEHMGGPAEVVPKLCNSLSQLGCRVTLIALDGPLSDATIQCCNAGVDLRTHLFKDLNNIGYSPDLSKDLRNLVGSVDIIHNHGMWQWPNWAATKWARCYKKPLVITPHGVLTKGMLQRSRLKKLIAWALFDKKSIKYASAIQAFTEAEMLEMQPRIKGKNIVILPNGVDLWELPDKNVFQQRFPQIHGRKVLLFLARVHPIKGVFDLIDAWKILCKRHQQWHLVIAGKLEAECIGTIDAKIKNLGLHTSVTLAGPQYGDHRLEAYAAADAFILPSYAEGFSTSILEAMACRLPVVYTLPCNFPEAAGQGAGILGPTGVEPLVKNLEKFFNMSDAGQKEMGNKGRGLVERQYTWPKVGRQMLAVYEWLIHRAEKPECIYGC
jgi:glycosyltransferase involved in cell wall biosynthesis